MSSAVSNTHLANNLRGKDYLVCFQYKSFSDFHSPVLSHFQKNLFNWYLSCFKTYNEDVIPCPKLCFAGRMNVPHMKIDNFL